MIGHAQVADENLVRLIKKTNEFTNTSLLHETAPTSGIKITQFMH